MNSGSRENGGRAPWFEPLTPTAFLTRAAAAYSERTAVVDGDRQWSYRELDRRCRQLAAALRQEGDTRPVAVLAPNSHVLLEAHYGVPWSGRPLLALNTRLGASEIAWMLWHCGATTLIYDSDWGEVVETVRGDIPGIRLVEAGPDGGDYEQFLGEAPPFAPPVEDENGLLSINYTSGSTGFPKGVMYSHRGAYLQALAMVAHAGLGVGDRYLWTLPMFHCNGWCFTWAVTAAGATHVCLRRVDPSEIWQKLQGEGITRLCGAPIILNMIASAPEATPADRRLGVRCYTGGAPPTPTIIARMEELGIEVTHLYGLTETYGPAVVCDWQPEWSSADAGTRARLRARQGVANVVAQPLRVLHPEGNDVPADGLTSGEVCLRGNNVMLGYLDDAAATEEATINGWFRTGDLAVMHPDGYIELKDRLKDVIISGGENISSVELESVLAAHPAVFESAVVARPDERWGEVPIAYVQLKEGGHATEDELIGFVRERVARFKAPKSVIFGELPRTSTGKVQKHVLRGEVVRGASSPA